MKRSLLTLALSCLAVVSLRADLIYYESFNYPDGPINLVGTNVDGSTNWFRQSGSGNDALVHNHKLEVSTSTGTGSPAPARTDDVNRKLCVTSGCTFTNGAQALYASFTVNFT